MPYIINQYQRITVEIPLESPDLPEDTYDLKVVGHYSGKRITTEMKNYIKINSPLKIDIAQSEIECPANTLCKPEITINVKFPIGDITDFTVENFNAVIMGKGKTFKKIHVDSIECSKQSDSCNIKLDIPANLEPGSYDLFLTTETTIENKDYESQDSIPLEVVLRIFGTLKDAGGNVVSAVITFENLKTGQSISGQVGPSGGYSINILPGEYSVEIRLGGGVVARFYNVTVSSSDSLLSLSDNLIRYDQGHLNSGAPAGVRVVKIIVLEFGLPFSNAWFYVPYDSSRVSGDEKDLNVYICRDWNFERSSCTGTWERVTCEVHTIRDGVEFEVDSTSAFIIGEQRGLHFSHLELEREEVHMGDTIVVNGKLLDTDGNAVENAQIRLSFPAFNMSTSSATTTGGFFRATINAPYLTGYPELLIEGIKYPYRSCNETKTVKVTRSKELSILNIPDIVDVPLNEPRDINFTLFNSGQTNLTEPIYIHVMGISSDWYELSPAKVNGLGISEQKNINLRIYLTPELCGGACKKFTLVNLEAKSDEISRVVSFTIKITSPLNETGSAEVEKKEGGSIIPDITGFTISIPSVSSPYLPLTIIVILLILILNKKKTAPTSRKTFGKQGKRGHELRSSIVSSLHRIKKNL
ncbi:MAG TPA: carboxypeptidase regulatory-like domain-containing protein [Candidatus Altiarchaeales archaeon]|nr:carboxypeptidase regulatory-like domain-containing protein [Candidatus Altiarchaeales archaeon]